MGSIASQSFWKPWIRRSKTPLIKRLRLYNVTCVSLMMYNCHSWAASKVALDKLDACHRKHLCTITGYRWPDSILSNDALCNTSPLSVKVAKQRRSMFGHVLRMAEETSAQRTLKFALFGASKYKARRGRHCINLLSVLRGDLKKAGLGTLKLRMDLRKLRIG
jgi:hypothetical protein